MCHVDNVPCLSWVIILFFISFSSSFIIFLASLPLKRYLKTRVNGQHSAFLYSPLPFCTILMLKPSVSMGKIIIYCFTLYNTCIAVLPWVSTSYEFLWMFQKVWYFSHWGPLELIALLQTSTSFPDPAENIR